MYNAGQSGQLSKYNDKYKCKDKDKKGTTREHNDEYKYKRKDKDKKERQTCTKASLAVSAMEVRSGNFLSIAGASKLGRLATCNV